MVNILNKLRDFCDSEVSIVILMDNDEELSVLCEAIVSADYHRFKYVLYKDDMSAYTMEVRMPYNRYIKMMKNLHKLGWSLTQLTNVDIINRMIRF